MKSKKLSVSTWAVVAVIAVLALQSAFYFQILPSPGDITEATSQTLMFYLLTSLTFGSLLILLERKNYILFGGGGTVLLATSMALSVCTFYNNISPMPLAVTWLLNIIFLITSVIALCVLLHILFGDPNDNKQIGDLDENDYYHCDDDTDDDVSDEEMVNSDIWTKALGSENNDKK